MDFVTVRTEMDEPTVFYEIVIIVGLRILNRSQVLLFITVMGVVSLDVVTEDCHDTVNVYHADGLNDGSETGETATAEQVPNVSSNGGF